MSLEMPLGQKAFNSSHQTGTASASEWYQERRGQQQPETQDEALGARLAEGCIQELNEECKRSA